MLYLSVISAAFAAGLVAFLVSLAVPVRSRSVQARMAELGLEASTGASARSRRRERSRKLKQIITAVGDRLVETGGDNTGLRDKLRHAGYRDSSALVIFLGTRLLAAVGFAFVGFVLMAAGGLGGPLLVVGAAWGAGVGWIVPGFIVSMKASARQKEIQKSLPDGLDLLVICVEAGLGLNQALIRVAREIRHVSGVLSTELSLTNLQIRAGTPREEALRDLAARTGVQDVRTLVTTMIQTERFGTSIAHSLRVQADTLRLKRKQRAQEAAAKTAIKMVFPLAICIFPALFVVILGPAVMQIIDALGSL